MPSIDTYRKHAKQLVRWHRERNFSLGGKVRQLERFRARSDSETLDEAFPLALAQEIVAVEAGFADWAALKAGIEEAVAPALPADAAPLLMVAVPVLFVRDVAAAAEYYRDRLGFAVDFLHGQPPFYASVSRDRACLHLRHVGQPNFAALAEREVSLILATVAVTNVKALFEDYAVRGVDFAQRLVRQPWGGLDFHARDPGGNVVSFVQYAVRVGD